MCLLFLLVVCLLCLLLVGAPACCSGQLLIVLAASPANSILLIQAKTGNTKRKPAFKQRYLKHGMVPYLVRISQYLTKFYTNVIITRLKVQTLDVGAHREPQGFYSVCSLVWHRMEEQISGPSAASKFKRPSKR